MDAQWLLIDRLFWLESRYARFIESLDPRCTVTLTQLLTGHAVPPELGAYWLCLRTFVARFTALARFLDVAHGCGLKDAWEHFPLVFFQAAPEETDVAHLHGATEVSAKLIGGPKGALIPPLQRFASRADRPHVRVLGYRLPDYRALLSVDAETATQYFARIVGDGICSRLLPTAAATDRPFLHNATVLNAMRVPVTKLPIGWERTIREECTDPLFFLEAVRRVSPADAGKDNLKRFIMNRLRHEYVIGAEARMQSLCGIGIDAPLKRRRANVQAVLDAMLRDGFRKFAAAQAQPAK